MFGLGNLFYVILLLTNSVAILNEERFLKRLGLSDSQSNYNNNSYGGQQFTTTSSSVQDNNTMFARVIQLIRAIQTVLRIPLIIVNVLVVVYELIFG
ncbi:hypothetical protein WICPIJ_008148 [Wickerhamomyces pijperi]|uniref:Yos1-like protein n=1 Tax=Wickerhamomyces pijperi TaxID=599730 RepID=A0A9P8PYB1_WICPI|nr:hypothetical protein WICPIJ_008148 [Wickerhamomyces pijperi]